MASCGFHPKLRAVVSVMAISSMDDFSVIHSPTNNSISYNSKNCFPAGISSRLIALSGVPSKPSHLAINAISCTVVSGKYLGGSTSVIIGSASSFCFQTFMSTPDQIPRLPML